ncbi:hypothetical protein V2J09_012575 [Rumex salicifolius]
MQFNHDNSDHDQTKQPEIGEEEEDLETWVRDSSLDRKGNTPLRSSTGVWKASLFIIAIEFSERLSYFGIATNLISYLTGVMRQDLGTAAKNVNYWAGVTTVTPLIGGFLADAYVGRFPMVLGSSFLYLMGLSLLTMTQYIPSLKPCGTKEACPKARITHDITFFVAAYMISIATGGFKPCLESFGADQFDDNHPKERKQKTSFFNWWNAALCLALIFGVTFIVYAEDDAGWGVAFLILTVFMAFTIVIFYLGRMFYRYRVAAKKSLFTPMLQVLVAAFAKRRLPYPSNPSLLYEVFDLEGSQGRRLCHTKRLRFLDKASILIQENEVVSSLENHQERQKQNNPWKLATITQVEELKLVLNIIPIWLTSMMIGVNLSQSSTFFVKQGGAMNRTITSDFKLPPASIYALSGVGIIISVTIYDRILLPFLRRITGSEHGITILKRIGTGMAISTISMVIAALVERKRLRSDAILSVFWLAPQFLVLGMGEGFVLVGLQEYFYEEVPDSMRSLGMAMYLSVIGIGSFLSSLLIVIVDNVTNKNGSGGWIGKDVNHSRLDLFYWVLAVLNGVNLVGFLTFARKYSYKSVKKSVVDIIDGRSCV